MTIVELSRTVDGPALQAFLGGTLEGARLVVDSIDVGAVLHQIEAWNATRSVPLVPIRIDESTLALALPAA